MKFDVIDITYQIDGVDITPIKTRNISFEFTACEFKIYNAAHLVDSKPEYVMDTFYGTAITPDEFMYSDCRKKKMSTKLKRSLR